MAACSREESKYWRQDNAKFWMWATWRSEKRKSLVMQELQTHKGSSAWAELLSLLLPATSIHTQKKKKHLSVLGLRGLQWREQILSGPGGSFTATKEGGAYPRCCLSLPEMPSSSGGIAQKRLCCRGQLWWLFIAKCCVTINSWPFCITKYERERWGLQCPERTWENRERLPWLS